MNILEARGIEKIYTDVAKPLEVLRGIDFSLSGGKIVGIYGASGSGKSTLLHILGGLDSPSCGSVSSKGRNLDEMNERELSIFRNENIGFVFQFYHLLPEFTALENVMLPVLISGRKKKDAEVLAKEALKQVDLTDRMEHRPQMLSGGEQQRVALARAFVMKPAVIMADEPTGNLDRETGNMIWKHLISLNKKSAVAIIVVTHNRDLIGDLDEAYELADGRLRKLD